MSVDDLFTRHERTFQAHRFVYPVLSRRAGGISIGVNLNPDKVCNFDCVYCQVDRTTQSETRFVEIDALAGELDRTLDWAVSGQLFADERFRDTPAPLRTLRDIAFSGDGEPTTYRNFDEIVERCAEIKRRHGLNDVKMVLITNASMFHREHVERGLRTLDANQGEIWAKLDAGTEAYFRTIARAPFTLARILANVTAAARERPIVIQSLQLRLDGQPPPAAEIAALCDRLTEITTAGGQIKQVQIYTLARPPAESNVTALTNAEVDGIVEQVVTRTGLKAVAYYGRVAESA